MIEDIRVFKQSGVSGVVFGSLTPSGHIDLEKTRRQVIFLGIIAQK
jgi:copper homeostasis protein CutC